jgi:hypothetical protein
MSSLEALLGWLRNRLRAMAPRGETWVMPSSEIVQAALAGPVTLPVLRTERRVELAWAGPARPDAAAEPMGAADGVIEVTHREEPVGGGAPKAGEPRVAPGRAA